MTSKAQRAWDALEGRGRSYLRLIYEADQEQERTHRVLAAREWDGEAKVPAREWRRILFNGKVPHEYPLEERFRHEGIYNRHTATLTHLHQAGLIEVDGLTRPIYLWLTTRGRAAARAGLAHTPAERVRRAGLLSDYLWRDLVKIAVAGDDGVRELDVWRGLYRTLTGPRRPFVEIRKTTRTAPHATFPGEIATWHEDRCFLTEQGRAHYLEHLATYREVYPQITAPDLADPATGPR